MAKKIVRPGPAETKDMKRAASNARKPGPYSKPPSKKSKGQKSSRVAVAGTSPRSKGEASGSIPGNASIGDFRRSVLPSRRIEVVERGLGGTRWRVQAWDSQNWKYEASVFFESEKEARDFALALTNVPFEEAVAQMLEHPGRGRA